MMKVNFIFECVEGLVSALTSAEPLKRKTDRMTTEASGGVALGTDQDIKDAERALARKVDLDDLELATLRLDVLRFAKERDKITSQGFNSIEDLIDAGDQILQFALNGPPKKQRYLRVTRDGLFGHNIDVVIDTTFRVIRAEAPSGHVIIGFTDAPKEFGTDLSKFMSEGPGETAIDAGGQQ